AARRELPPRGSGWLSQSVRSSGANRRRRGMQETEKIWMNGELVDWADAKVHVGAHGLHYGSGVFEGIRAYETPKGTAVFRLAEMEANRAGYDEALLLTADGYVADGSGENIFVVKDGIIYTPDLSASILPGITRDSVTQIAQDLGYQVVAKNLIRTDLYLADEVFMTGTAAEVTPIREIDDHVVGVGQVTLELQQAYLDTVRGRSERWSQWLEHAPARSEA